MSATEAIRVPLRCSSCGEPLYTRVRVCPLCGAADPLEGVDDAASDERPDELPGDDAPRAGAPAGAPAVDVDGGAEVVAPAVMSAEPAVVRDDVDVSATDGADEAALRLPDDTAVDAPVDEATDAASESERAVGVPDAADAGPFAESSDAESSDAFEADADAAAADVGANVDAADAADAATAAAAGRASARAGMLDIAPDRDGPAPEPGRDLVIVPERGGRDVALYAPRRRGALATVLTTLGAVVLLAVVGVFAWRMVEPMQAAAPEARQVAVGRSWQSLELAPLAAGEDWVLSADGPFRLRVDGVVYTLASPVPFAVPLDGKSVEIRAVADDVTVSVSRR